MTAVLDPQTDEAVNLLDDVFWLEFENAKRLREDDDSDETSAPLQGVSIEAVIRPRCPRTGQMLSEHLESVDQAGTRRAREAARKPVLSRKPKPKPLTDLERIRLHNGTIDLKVVKGRRLTRCDRQAVKRLKKLRRKAAKKH